MNGLSKMPNLRELMATREYQDAAERIQVSLRLRVRPAVPLALLDVESRRIAAAGYELASLQQALGDMPKLTQFVRAKLRKYLGAPTEQAYPEGEEPEEGDEDEVLSTGDFAPNYLVGHLLEFTLLSQGGDLLGFLTATRMPKAKKYAAELRQWFAELP